MQFSLEGNLILCPQRSSKITFFCSHGPTNLKLLRIGPTGGKPQIFCIPRNFNAIYDNSITQSNAIQFTIHAPFLAPTWCTMHYHRSCGFKNFAHYNSKMFDHQSAAPIQVSPQQVNVNLSYEFQKRFFFLSSAVKWWQNVRKKLEKPKCL